MRYYHLLFVLIFFPVLVSATTPITGAAQVGTTNSLRVTWGETDVNLTSPDVSLNRYQVSYNEVGQPAIVIDNIGSSLREYTITGLTLGKTYEVKVIEVIRVNIPPSPFTPPFIDNFNSSAVQTVSLNSSPIAICRNIIKSAGANGTVTITASEIDNGSSDPDNGMLIYSLNTVGPFAVGTHSVTLTVTEPGGLTNSCTATVTVIDDTAPDVFTKEPVLELDPYGNVTLTLPQIVIGFADNAGTITNVELSKTQFNCNDLGEQQVQVSVTDNAGNVARKQVKVTVRDFIVPFIRHENQYFTLAANGYATLRSETLHGMVWDNCGIAEVSASQTTFSSADIGSNHVEVVARDASGNEKRLMIVVTIADNTPPVAQVKEATVALDASGRGTLSVDDIDAGSTDNVGIVQRELSRTEFTIVDLGGQEVTLNLLDGSGNSVSASARVNVVDPVAPVVSAADVSLVADSNGYAALPLSEVEVVIDEVGELDSVYLSQSEFVLPKDSVCRVTLTAVDRSGNVGSGTFMVMLKDTTSPAKVVAISTGVPESGNVAKGELSKKKNGTVNQLIGSDQYLAVEKVGEIISSYGPNPTNGEVQVFFNRNQVQVPKVKLTDVSGRMVQLLKKPKLVNDLTLSVEIGHLQTGVYLLTVKQGYEQKTVKIVKE